MNKEGTKDVYTYNNINTFKETIGKQNNKTKSYYNRTVATCEI